MRQQIDRWSRRQMADWKSSGRKSSKRSIRKAVDLDADWISVTPIISQAAEEPPSWEH
jgi:hypothetical protein